METVEVVKDLGNILKVKTAGLSDRLNIQSERNRDKSDFKV